MNEENEDSEKVITGVLIKEWGYLGDEEESQAVIEVITADTLDGLLDGAATKLRVLDTKEEQRRDETPRLFIVAEEMTEALLVRFAEHAEMVRAERTKRQTAQAARERKQAEEAETSLRTKIEAVRSGKMLEELETKLAALEKAKK